MAITVADLKFFQSERMTDEDDGGGQMTATEIVSGESNQIFDDLSDVDFAAGDCSVRKAYAAVTSADTDKYLDSGVIVFRAPENNNVSVLATSTGSYFDERADIQAYLENYLVRGPRFAGFLYETQIAGARAITFFGRVGDEPPGINTTLLLVEFTNEDHETESYSQYVRVIRILLNEIQSFTDENGTYNRQIVTLELSEALRYTFHGHVMSRYDDIAPLAMIYSCVVADAARYYGIRPTTALAETGDYSVYVDAIYDRLVPSSQTETPNADLTAAAERTFAVPVTASTISFLVGDTFSPDFRLYVGRGFVPGTLSITVTGGTLTDDGGQLLSGTTSIGTVDYTTGTVVFGATSPTYAGSKTVAFQPAAPLARASNSYGIPVTENTRYRSYVASLTPIPNKGTLIVDYLSRGNWYRLQDNGNGILQGSSANYGSGTLNFNTGSVTLTLGAYPDINSSIVFIWGSGADTTIHTATDLVATFNLNSGVVGIDPGSAVLTWASYTLTDQGDGTMTGTGGSATINYGDGSLAWTPDAIPAEGSTLTLAYDKPAAQYCVYTPLTPSMDGNGILTIPISTGAIEATINFTFYAQVLASELAEPDSPSQVKRLELALADGAGGWQTHSGTINVADGTMTLDSNVVFPSITVPYYETVNVLTWAWNVGTSAWEQTTVAEQRLTGLTTLTNVAGRWDGQTAYLRYSTSASVSSGSATLTLNSLALSLKPATLEPVVPGSLQFDLGSRTYRDDGSGAVIYAVNPATGLGTAGGTVDYASGIVTLTDWEATANSIDVTSRLGQIERVPMWRAVFRTPAAPVAVSSFSFSCERWSDGTAVTGDADTHGVISATAGALTVNGRIDYQTGVVDIRFSDLIDLTTLLYNCVTYSSLPLDSSIIGLDPTRLPGDGKVPIFRDGQLILVHYTDTVVENSLSPTQQVDMGQVRLYRVVIEDAGEQRLPASFYSVDRETGIVTMAADLNLTGYTGPYTFYHSIADLSVISDADLSGKLTLTRALSHDFPATDSRVSGVLYAGTQQARYTHLFAQTTWTSVWSDERIGDEPLAQYDDVSYPVTVSNLGAYQDRILIRFTSSTNFSAYGENLGLIGTGNINEDFAPLRTPDSEAALFDIDYRGWGGGWSTGNCLRFNLIGANYPVDLIRSVQPSSPTGEDDSVELLFFGNVNA